MDCLCRADSGKVAVALVCEHQPVGVKAFCGCGYSRGASVCRLNPVYVDVVVCENRASYRCNAYCYVFRTHFLYNLGNESVNHTMTASGAVVHVVVVHQTGLGADNVLCLLYVVAVIHCRVILKSAL